MIFEMENHKNFKPGAAFSINERSGIYEPEQLLGSSEWNGSSVGVLPDRKLLYGFEQWFNTMQRLFLVSLSSLLGQLFIRHNKVNGKYRYQCDRPL